MLPAEEAAITRALYASLQEQKKPSKKPEPTADVVAMDNIAPSTTKPMLDAIQSSDFRPGSQSDSSCSNSPSPRSGSLYPITPLKRLKVGPTTSQQRHGSYGEFTFEDSSDSIMETLVTYQQLSTSSQVSSPTASSDSISSSLRLVLSTSSWTSSSSSSQWSPSPVLPSSPSSLSSSASLRSLPRKRKRKRKREAKGNLAVHPSLFTSPKRSEDGEGTHVRVKPQPKKSPKESLKDKSLSKVNKSPKSVRSKRSPRTKAADLKTKRTSLDEPNSSVSAETETPKDREVVETSNSRLGSPNSWFVDWHNYTCTVVCTCTCTCTCTHVATEVSINRHPLPGTHMYVHTVHVHLVSAHPQVFLFLLRAQPGFS